MAQTNILHQSEVTNGWRAKLALGYRYLDGKTRLTHRQHSGPLLVQRAFYPETEGVCHQYILHPPGGVVGGDQLNIDVDVAENAHTLITTPAAGKFYRSSGATACQSQSFTVADGGMLEWLPQETILYESSKVRLSSEIHLTGDAKFIGWEITCLGRPAAGVDYGSASSRQAIRLFRDGRLLMAENAVLEGESPMMRAKWGFAEFTSLGSLWVSPADKDLLEAVQTLIRENKDQLASVTLLRGSVLVCRCLAHEAMAVRGLFAEIWKLARLSLCGLTACPPRVWQT